MIWYEIVNGKNVNDYDNYGDYLSKDKALRIAKALPDDYVRVDSYEGDFKGRDGDYTNTIYERLK